MKGGCSHCFGRGDSKEKWLQHATESKDESLLQVRNGLAAESGNEWKCA